MANRAVAEDGDAAAATSAGRLLHYSATPITLDRACVYARCGFAKPRGFWFSVEGEQCWRSWCENEGFAIERLTCVHEVILAETSNVLRIDSDAAFAAFDAAYAPRDDALALASDWAKLRAEYDGLIIAPYRWERRMESLWYYGWDCASGVIWNLGAIAELRLLR